MWNDATQNNKTMWIVWERPLCTFASLCLQESSPRLAMLCPSVRFPAWLCVVLPVRHPLLLPPPFSPLPRCLLCVLFPRCDVLCKLEFRHRSKISFLMPKNPKWKKKPHNTDLRSVSRGNVTASLSCNVRPACWPPRNTVIHFAVTMATVPILPLEMGASNILPVWAWCI